MIGPGLCCIGIALSTGQWQLCVGFIVIAFGFMGAAYSGRFLVPYEVTPSLSGATFGFINMFGSCAGFVTPIVTEAFTGKDPGDPAGWQRLFGFTCGLFLVVYLVWLIVSRFRPLDFDSKPKPRLSEA